MATGEHDATTTTAATDGEGAGVPDGPAAPGEDLSSPSGTPAGPVPPDEDQDQAEAGEPEPGKDVARQFATVEWQAPFWGRQAGHRERLELTPIVRGAITGGKLVVIGEIETEAPPGRPPARRR